MDDGASPYAVRVERTATFSTELPILFHRVGHARSGKIYGRRSGRKRWPMQQRSGGAGENFPGKGAICEGYSRL